MCKGGTQFVVHVIMEWERVCVCVWVSYIVNGCMREKEGKERQFMVYTCCEGMHRCSPLKDKTLTYMYMHVHNMHVVTHNRCMYVCVCVAIRCQQDMSTL